MAPEIDPDVQRRLDEHLKQDLVVWLTTVSADGTPQPNPVWFITDGDDIIIYSNHRAARNRTIARNNRVSLNFNSDPHGSHMTVMTGTATVDDTLPPANESAAYMEKYGELIPGLDMTPESYAETFSVPLRFTPGKVRGF